MDYRQLIPALLFCLIPILVMAETSPQQQISYQQLQSQIEQALVEAGAGDAVQASISNIPQPLFASSDDAPLSASVSFIHFDDRTQRFEAEISLYERSENLIRTQTLSGRFSSLHKVPVLSRRIAAGEIITADDVRMERFADNRLRHNAIYDEAALVGMAARRSIREGMPVAQHEVEAPRIVRKGDLIALHYRSANLEIKTVAEAMEDGALGNAISLRNTDSGQMLRATIIGSGQAEIQRTLLLSQNLTPQGTH